MQDRTGANSPHEPYGDSDGPLAARRAQNEAPLEWFERYLCCAFNSCCMSAEVREAFEKAVRVSGAVGAQLSIVRGGETLDLVHGLANAELSLPMTEDTLVQCGSVTKVFNATMIMSLVEEGKLDLDVPVK